MDHRLVAWARSVKSRTRHNRSIWPPLWLFTDEQRLPNPLAAVASLPRGLAGVIFRHDTAANRHHLACAIAKICRARGLTLIIAGDWRLAAALGAGVHLRSGRRLAGMPQNTAITSSAHSLRDLHQAKRAGASLAFLSPAFATQSHPGAASLGAARWTSLSRTKNLTVAALGGITGATLHRLPTCRAAGAIGALVA